MVNANNLFVLLLIAFICTIRSAGSISCYQCNSTDIKYQFQCTETMDNIGDLRPTPCTNLYNAAYCVTHIGFHNGGHGVRRYCSSHNLGNYCNYFKPPGDEKDYETCIYTCAASGCNGPGELKLVKYIKSLPIYRWFKNL
ncbi:U-scoloptoxin(05)-Sm1a-like [Metopolophium dirhodum]|uniref:U-scoloptoxin(05)-Sm1a-like n=1 Tax=Metopolophium dirhodum TaxID=44670 RepID=UPI0029902E8B|nr:U-scoloptoxin(05)-Sm1a-like [Metopolophium dirhodum]